MIETTTELIKRSLIRENGYPVGVRAPVYVNCGCGTKLAIVTERNQCSVCHTIYNAGGWIQ